MITNSTYTASPTISHSESSSATQELYQESIVWKKLMTFENLFSITISNSYFENIRHLLLPSTLEYSKLIDAIKLENVVTSKFGIISQVSAITAVYLDDFYLYTVFTSNQQYNGQLMDHLLDIEIEIKDQFKDLLIAIQYLTYIPESGKEIQLSGNESVLYKA